MKVEKEITINDLAEKVKVSPSTVSRALTGSSEVGRETKAKILAIAEKLGYRPNTFAKNLRQQKTNTIGVIVHDITSYFIVTVLEGIERVLADKNFDILIAHSGESTEKEIANTINLFNKRVDGLIISLAAETVEYSHLNIFIKKNIPVVCFNRLEKRNRCTKVVIDNYKAGYSATKHLIERGCKKIVHITGSMKRNVYKDRCSGYKEALLEVNQDHEVFVCDLSEEETIDVVQSILRMHSLPDGIFISSDFAAAVCIKQLKQANIKVPEDVAIVGFNNDVISRISETEITTIDYPAKQMGEVAASTLINNLNRASKNKNVTITLPSDLIERLSSQKVAVEAYERAYSVDEDL
jgi:LacI family transcriptional regulator